MIRRIGIAVSLPRRRRVLGAPRFFSEEAHAFSVHNIKMPKMDDIAEGTVDQWLKKAGEPVKNGDVVAHVTMGDLTVGVTANFNGILAELKFKEGDVVKCDATIAHSVDNVADYSKFLEVELKKIQDKSSSDAVTAEAAAMSAAVAVSPETVAAVAAAIEATRGMTAGKENTKTSGSSEATSENKDNKSSNAASAPASSSSSVAAAASAPSTEADADAKDVLREIKVLINSGIIIEESDFAKKILSLARSGDKQLLTVFEASFEAGFTSFADHSKFDYNFFLDNATDILVEMGHKDVVNPCAVDKSKTKSK